MIFDSDYPHLTVKSAELLKLDDSDRIEKIRSRRWIPYPAANKILEHLEDLLVHPKTHRMPNLLIIGNTNNGKTMLIEHFKRKHPAEDCYESASISIPVLSIQAPPTPDETRIYSAILTELFAPFRQTDRIDKKAAQVFKLMRSVGTKILIIDEIHSILAGSLNKQRVFLNVLKYLGNELKIPIVAVGTREAYRAVQTDPQLANRFAPVELPDWQPDQTYLRMLSSFEVMIPLKKKSNLVSKELAQKIYVMSEGFLGEISTLIVNAAVASIKNGSEQITLDTLDSLSFIAPSRRRLGPEVRV